MGKPVISVEGLGKCYQIGVAREKYPTFRDALVHAVKAPFRRMAEVRGDVTAASAFWALKDVSFEVQPGEVVAIIGKNGAGKSTLLKVLSRITEPTEGLARLRGRIASLLEVGTGFHPELTGRENVYLNGAIMGMRKAEIDRKFDEIVAFAETEKFIDTQVKRYSSGMYVRLAFAVAAHLEPEILIVDEVLAVGDSEFQKKCLGRMQQVASGEGRTVLFVSHNMGAIQRLCQRAVMLEKGRVTAIGEAGEIVDLYMDRSSKDGGATDLKQRPRGYGMSSLIAGFTCRPGEGQARVVSGGEANFEMECEFPQSLRNAAVGFSLNGDQGSRVVTFSTRWEKGHVSIASGKQTIRCKVDELMLTPGRYPIDLWIMSNGRLVDYIEHGVILNVEFGDYFGTGELPNTHEGKVIHKAKWEI